MQKSNFTGQDTPDDNLPFAMQKRLKRSRYHLRCGLEGAAGSMCYTGAHWRNLANTTEPSVCCSDEALSQITLTTCFWYGNTEWFFRKKTERLLSPFSCAENRFSKMFCCHFLATVCKTVRPMPSDRFYVLSCLCLSCLSVTLVYCGQTVGRIKLKLGMQVGLGPGHIVLDGDLAPSPKGHSLQFSAHVRCGQTAGWIKMPLGMEVGLGPGDCVLDGDPAPPKKGTQPPFSAHVYCGQTARWIKIPLNREVGWAHTTLCYMGPISPQKGHTAPNFRPMSVVAKRSPIVATAEQLLKFCNTRSHYRIIETWPNSALANLASRITTIFSHSLHNILQDQS